MAAVRTKSELLTAYAVELAEAWLVPLGVGIASPRDPRAAGAATSRCAGRRPGAQRPARRPGVIPDFRRRTGCGLGLSPLSTSFAEVHRGLEVLREVARGTPAS
jgi:kynureninase